MPTKHIFVKNTFVPVLCGGGVTDRISSISLTLGKTTYTVGDTFDLTGATVIATYLSGKTEDVTTSCTFSPAEHTAFSNMGSVVVTATYVHGADTYTTTQTVTVADALSSISMTAPTKASYTEGENLDLTGAVVTATYVSGATADVTSSCTFSPANGTELSTAGTQTITATYVENGITKTATVDVTVSAALTMTTWADGTWEQIAGMLAAHEAGTIDLYNTAGWEIGATRTVPLAAMAATGVGESHVAQDVEFVLMDKNVVDLAAGGKCNFVIGMKNCLANGTSLEAGYINSTNTNVGGWQDSARRTWCNNVFANAVPDGLKNLVKSASIKTSAGSRSANISTTTDTWFLPCEYNVFGSVARSVSGEDTVQWEWYKTSANIIKKGGASGTAAWWWERSPRSDRGGTFCGVGTGGGAGSYDADGFNGLAPVGCI